MTRLHTALLLTTLLAACGDSGVSVGGAPGNAGNGNGSQQAPGGSTGGSISNGNTDNPIGSTDPTGVSPPTTGIDNLDPQDVEAARLLMQATFGPTEASIADFRSYASTAAWLDDQFALPASITSTYTRANSNGSSREARHEIWWNNALGQPDQLRQRVAFALSQIFVASDLDYALSNSQYGMADYYDMLTRHAFGNYRELLEEVTLHPVMGVYLSMVRNEKANQALNIRPDENYAREVLQLFSIGLVELNLRAEAIPSDNPAPAYTQTTVEEFARLFTGWNYASASSWTTNNLGSGAYVTQMVPVEAFHDTGSKTLLNGAVVPAGLSTSADMQAALDNIFQHPNVGPFIGKQLIQRLVTSNPSPEYVERVATVFNNNGAGERGDLQAVIRAILLDEEARNGHLAEADFGKLREPVIKFAHFWRALSATPGPSANGVHHTADFPMLRLDEMSGQAILRSPSVFNFYLPDNPVVTGGNELSPEMQIMTEANLAATHNNYHHHVYRFHNRADLSDDNPRVTIVDLEPLVEKAGNPDELLDWYNLVFYAGSMPDAMRASLRSYMATLDNNDTGRFARVQDTLFMVLVSPAFHLQR